MNVEEFRALHGKGWKAKRRTQSKFGNNITKTDDGTFHSDAEHHRWLSLKLLERAGHIRNLERQVRFSFDHNGVHICDYIADFAYFDGEQRVIEDKKGVETEVFKLKAKMMLAFYGIEVRLT